MTQASHPTAPPTKINGPFTPSRRFFRSWFDTQDQSLLPAEGNHARTVCHWPDTFRLSPQILGSKFQQNTDYDEEVLYLAMLQGFVRISLPPKEQKGQIANLEGTRLNHLQMAAFHLFPLLHSVPNLVLVQRTGSFKNQAIGWLLQDRLEIENFAHSGTVSTRIYDFYQSTL